MLRADKAYDNLDCTVLGLNRFPELVQRCLIEAVTQCRTSICQRFLRRLLLYWKTTWSR